MWRPLAFALLAANLLFLAWASRVATPGGRPAGAAAPVAPPVASAPPRETPPRCVRLGPFTDAALAATVSQRLLAAALTPEPRDDVEVHRDGFWVSVAGKDTAEQRRTLQRLRAAGVQDAYAMPDDEQFRVSLGIYTDRQRAEQRAASLRPLSLPTVIQDHLQERTIHWIDVPGAGDRLSASRLEAFGVTDSDIGAFDCPARPGP